MVKVQPGSFSNVRASYDDLIWIDITGFWGVMGIGQIFLFHC
jgi:hypothetical protein